jgi:hypothetical protein
MTPAIVFPRHQYQVFREREAPCTCTHAHAWHVRPGLHGARRVRRSCQETERERERERKKERLRDRYRTEGAMHAKAE